MTEGSTTLSRSPANDNCTYTTEANPMLDPLLQVPGEVDLHILVEAYNTSQLCWDPIIDCVVCWLMIDLPEDEMMGSVVLIITDSIAD
jgi:hypothetical protein